MTKTCTNPDCLKAYDAMHPRSLFCSNTCKMKAHRARLKGELKAMPPANDPARTNDDQSTEGLGEKDGKSGKVMKIRKPKDLLPRHVHPDYLKTQPFVLPTGLSQGRLMEYLVGGVALTNGSVSGGMRGYNQTMIAHGAPQHCSTRRQVETWLAKSGYDWTLAGKLKIGLTPSEAPSPVLTAVHLGLDHVSKLPEDWKENYDTIMSQPAAERTVRSIPA